MRTQAEHPPWRASDEDVRGYVVGAMPHSEEATPIINVSNHKQLTMVNITVRARVIGGEPLVTFLPQFVGMEAIGTSAEELSNKRKGQPGAPQGRPHKPSR